MRKIIRLPLTAIPVEFVARQDTDGNHYGYSVNTTEENGAGPVFRTRPEADFKKFYLCDYGRNVWGVASTIEKTLELRLRLPAKYFGVLAINPATGK
jgi:hypothetical protein